VVTGISRLRHIRPRAPREIFQCAILVGACALIIGHNHPSGDLNASQDDVAITKKIKEAGALLGIPLLDHIIFSRTEFKSLKMVGLLE